jgi:hypothetical protein
MDKIPFIALLLYAAPEGMLHGTLGLSLVAVRPRFKTIFVYGILFAATAYLARQAPVLPGIHTLIIAVCASLYLTLLYRITWKKAFLAVILGLVFLLLGEMLFTPIVLSFTGLAVEEVAADPWLRVLVTLPQQLFLALSALVAYRLRGFHRHRYQYIKSYRSWGS